MRVEEFPTVKEFLSKTETLLTRDEVRHSLINGITRKLKTDFHAYGEDAPWFCVINDNTKICAATIRTPPHAVLLAYFEGDMGLIVDVLIEVVSKKFGNIPGVNGEKEIADVFTAKWCTSHQVKVNGKIDMRAYKLTKVNNVMQSAGKIRLAREEDRELIIKWAQAFHRDVYTATDSNNPFEDLTPKIAKKELYLWENGEPVAMAAKARPTQNGLTVNSVYTSPEFRNKGYATSCVAALCREILNSGYKYCTLFADLANPVSNSIYKKIGFNEVCDSVEYSYLASLEDRR